MRITPAALALTSEPLRDFEPALWFPGGPLTFRFELRPELQHALPLEGWVVAPGMGDECVALTHARLASLGKQSRVLIHVGHVGFAKGRNANAVEVSLNRRRGKLQYYYPESITTQKHFPIFPPD